METDALGTRMKEYEMAEAGRMLIPGLPVMVRLDGKAFHTFCQGLQKPFDERLTDLMIDTTKFLVEETNAVVGLVQSDEISLVLYTEKPESQLFFNGRIQKLTSVIASMCTAFFNRELPKALPEKSDKFAYFDCRVWNVPSLEEASNTLVWRELDATKNSISMVAQHYYSHNQLHGKSGKEKQEMLFQKGINWNDFLPKFKRGSYICRVNKFIKFNERELSVLPEKHQARINPELLVERSVVERIELPPILKIVNRVGVLFKGEPPVIKE